MTCGCSTTTSPSSLSTIMAFGGKRKYGKRYRSKKHHNRSTKTTTRTLYRKKRNHKTKGKKKKQIVTENKTVPMEQVKETKVVISFK